MKTCDHGKSCDTKAIINDDKCCTTSCDLHQQCSECLKFGTADCTGVDPTTVEECSATTGAADCCVCVTSQNDYTCLGAESPVMPAEACPVVYWQHRYAAEPLEAWLVAVLIAAPIVVLLLAFNYFRRTKRFCFKPRNADKVIMSGVAMQQPT